MTMKDSPKKDISAIRFGYGIGDLCFGSTMDECRAYCGEPDEEVRDYFEDEEFVTWYYGDGEVILSFEEGDSYCLGCIIAGHPGITLNGQHLYGMSMDEVKTYLTENGYDFNEEIDEENSWSSSLEVDDLEGTFIFEDGNLEAVEWSYFWLDDETPRWPE